MTRVRKLKGIVHRLFVVV